jgi:hypothetical protein
MSVEVGQVWRDRDRRMSGRLVRVERIDPPYAHCIEINPATMKPRQSRVRVRLMVRRLLERQGWEPYT